MPPFDADSPWKERPGAEVVNGGRAVSVAIVSPGYPDRPGGVTAHTARVVRHWTEASHPPVVWGEPRGRARELVRGLRQAGVQALLIQYVPFLYGRRGLSAFPRRLAVAAREEGLRVGVFVHEPWVPPTRLPWFVLSPLQRRQLLALVELADVVLTPVPAWHDRLGKKAELLYVGSTLEDAGLPGRTGSGDEAPPLAAPVVFSPFAAGLAWDWIVSAARAVGARPGLAVIGADWEAAARHPIVKRYADPTWDWRGYLEGPEVLAVLRRARVVLAPFVDGLTGRRTSALAAGSVGAVVVTSRGHLFDPALAGGPFAVAATEDEFCELAVRWHGVRPSAAEREGRVAWYRERLEGRSLDERLWRLLLGHSDGD